jgi:hypothetical protein
MQSASFENASMLLITGVSNLGVSTSLSLCSAIVTRLEATVEVFAIDVQSMKDPCSEQAVFADESARNHAIFSLYAI